MQPLLPFHDITTKLDQAQQIVGTCPEQFREGFLVWVTGNWALYLRFEAEAVKVGQRRRHYSCHTLIEFMRHETMLTDHSDAEFKLNEKWSSSLARLFAHLNPDYRELFEFRVRKGGVVSQFEQVA